MDFECKVISKEVSQLLWERGKTVGTAESCTGGRIAEAMIAIPGASKYFKGGIVCYTDEVKERLLNVSPELIAEKTAVCEEVAIALVEGACASLSTDYAIAATGIAGPTGGTKEIPVGTIWLACGRPGKVKTTLQTDNRGRDLNLEAATHNAMQLFLDYLKDEGSDMYAGEDGEKGLPWT